MTTRSDSYERETVRVYIVLAVMLLALGILVANLWRLQVVDGEEYERTLEKQSIRGVRLPGRRGMILDRNGVPLAENRPSFCIAIYLEDLRRFSRLGHDAMAQEVVALIEKISVEIDREVEVTPEQIERHIKTRSPLPLLAWRDVEKEAIARLVESSDEFPGVAVYLQPVRTYRYGPIAGHVLGHVGRTSTEEGTGERPRYMTYYLPEIEGRCGIEGAMESFLHGEHGAQLIRVDAAGFTYTNLPPRDREIMRTPEPGSDIKLTIDIEIQKLAEEALVGLTGAVVVLDTRDCDVLAMASAPSFNPNDFATGISRAKYATLTEHPGHPLVNRAVAGVYAPGSVFKVVVAIAAMEKGKAGASTAFRCPGYYALGRTKKLRCWNWRYGGHGLIAMEKAIEQSCNVYFCHLGEQCGYEAIYDTATSVGFGQKTGIQMKGEQSGNMPAKRTIRTKGDVANVSIGQGAIQVTPIQMAVLTATIANDGYYRQPRLVLAVRGDADEDFKEFPVAKMQDLGWKANTMKVLKNGMLAVVEAPRGTGKRVKVEGIRVAGKTGTAEYGLKDEGNKHGWMIVFAPYEKPRYAIAMVADDAVSGGITIAPRLQKLLEGIFEKEDESF